MAPTRRSHHRWTAFEQYTLLCIFCRQIQRTGTPGPKQVREKGQRKTIFSMASSAKRAHRDVADLLNRSLNYEDHTKDIPAQEVSAMIDQLMEEKKDAIEFLERQKAGRITRAVRKVWDRSVRVDRSDGGGLRSAVQGEGERGGGGGGMGRDNVSATTPDMGDAGAGSSWSDRVVDSLADAEGDDDPWGDKVVASSVLPQSDPWGESDEVMTSFTDVHVENDAWGPSYADVPMTDVPDTNDPWGSTKSTFVSNTVGDDAWPSWTSPDSTNVNTTASDDHWASRTVSIAAHINYIDPNDPWADTSAALTGAANAGLISNQVQSTAIATTPSRTPLPDQISFTGINSERLIMLNTGEEIEDDADQEPICSSDGISQGENAVELPFNRLAMQNSKKRSGIELENTNELSDISEEE